MESAACKLPASPPLQTLGTVLSVASDGVTVGTDFGVSRVSRAVSCLVAPEPGDLVLLAGDPAEALYLIAVLERPGGAPTQIAVDGGDLAVRVPNGRFSVAAGEGVGLVSATEVAIAAPELEVRSARGYLCVDQLSFVGRQVLAQVEKLKLVAGFLDQVLERVTQRVKRSYRKVEEIDHLAAAQIHYRASKNLDLRGQNALLTAEELVKLDGDQIHLG